MCSYKRKIYGWLNNDSILRREWAKEKFPSSKDYPLLYFMVHCDITHTFVLLFYIFFKICPLDKCITKEHNTNYCSSRPFSNQNVIHTLNNIVNKGPAFTTLELSLRGQTSLCSLCCANIRFNVTYFLTLLCPSPLP